MKKEGYLCPSCGNFSLTFVRKGNGEDSHYLCLRCGERIRESDYSPILNEDSMHRFPSGKDITPSTNLDKFMKGKKQ
ncbi:MAG: hypothetical protein K6B65_03435 [Bacilli bacterium]|nr:hypothetical protein [Bacilli bacterium]